MSDNNQWVCSQIGPREYYSIPKALNNISMLKKFYTDLWIKNSIWPIKNYFIERYDQELSSYTESLGNTWSLKNKIFKSNDVYKKHCDYGREFALRVNRKLKGISFNTYFSYNTGALETFIYLKERNVNCILGQIDPGRVEKEILVAEYQKFPDWPTDSYNGAPDSYFDRIEQEWRYADKIIVNSNWSKQALLQRGVADDKIEIIPLSYEPKAKSNFRLKSLKNRKLKVLWVGNVILRKGIQYLIACAESMVNENVEFIIIGTISISKEILKRMPKNVTFLGKISRELLPKYYLSADVFILPTISDGFAITQIEAMSYGLPVITTNRCGDVVAHMQDGVIVDVYDSNSLVDAIMLFLDNDFLNYASKNAYSKSKFFGISSLEKNLASLNKKLQS